MIIFVVSLKQLISLLPDPESIHVENAAVGGEGGMEAQTSEQEHVTVQRLSQTLDKMSLSLQSTSGASRAEIHQQHSLKSLTNK